MSAGTQTTEWTNKRLLEWTAEYLNKAGIEQPRLCAEILLAHVLGWQRIELYTRFDTIPQAEQLAKYRELVKRCSQQEPVAYLIGYAHFYSLKFTVNAACLIPRPETEVLAAEAIDFLTHTTRPTPEVLELCTGSGCIAAAVATHVVEAEVLAVDISDAALEVARKNIEHHELAGRVTLLAGDLFAPVEASGKGIFDLIVANPPYISSVAYPGLPANVRDYEPRLALEAGADGLDVVRRILAGAERYLADSGALMLEIAYDQGPQTLALFEQAGYLKACKIVKDHAGRDRVVQGFKS